MKIIEGNFGVKGTAYISSNHKLVIEGASKRVYDSEHITSVSASVIKEKKFGILGFIVGTLILSVILGTFYSMLGVIIAIVIAIAGSFYSDTKNIVEVKFKDDKMVVLECTPRGVKKLVQLAPN